MELLEFEALAKEYGAQIGYYQAENLDSEHFYFLTEWVSGGITGNSCWSEIDDEPEIIEADWEEYTLGIEYQSFMSKLGISAQDAAAVAETLMLRGTYIDNEDYYGNYTEHTYLAISVGMLHKHLTDNNLLVDYGGLDSLML